MAEISIPTLALIKILFIFDYTRRKSKKGFMTKDKLSLSYIKICEPSLPGPILLLSLCTKCVSQAGSSTTWPIEMTKSNNRKWWVHFLNLTHYFVCLNIYFKQQITQFF